MSEMVNQYQRNNPKVQELITKSKINFANKKPQDIARRLSAMYDKGLLSKKSNDLDNAFILLYRYSSSVEFIQNTKDYRNSPSSYKKYMPASQIEEVKLSLDEISKLLNTVSHTATNNTGDIDLNADKHLTLNQNTLDDRIPAIPFNFPDTPTDEPIDGEVDNSFMTCTQLYNLLSESRYLIIDMRPIEDFDRSRIKTTNCVNIPAKAIKEILLAKRCECYLREHRSSADALLFEHRSRVYLDSLIIIDWMTNSDTVENAQHLLKMKKLLTAWDFGNIPPNIYFLNGGYAAWLHSYPSCVTDPQVTPPNIMTGTNALDEILEDVKYPDWLGTDEIMPNLKNNSDMNNMTTRRKHTNSHEPELIRNNSSINSNELKQPFIHIDEESVDLSRLSQEVENIDLTTKKKSSSPSPISKPTIDRSSKPITIPNNQKSEAVLSALVALNGVLEQEEKIERQLTNIDSEIYSSYNNENYDADDLDTLRSQKNAVELTQQNLSTTKQKLESEWESIKSMNIPMTKTDLTERKNLELKHDRMKARIAGVVMDRKKQQKAHEQQQNLLTLPKHNNNLIYKEPLKSEGSTTNTGLKRSLSSPNLVQVKKSKTENQQEDRKTPQIDRSSKPLNARRNVRETNNDNNNLPIASRDPAKRMDPVYRHVHPGITGLKNLGNSCYMNSIIQCLSNTAYLANYFIENSYQDDLNTNIDNETRGQIAEEFAHVIKALWRGQYKSIAPRDLKNTIGQYRLQFDSCEQQDSHEFLTFLLDWMHNDLRKADSKLRRDGPLSAAEKEWEKAMEGQMSTISQLFNGQLRSSITCLTCSSRSITYETFNSLSISLTESNRCTLDDCLKNFLSGQRISGWACPNCKIPRDATKKFDFVKLAPIMVIHLNRFAGTDVGLEKKNTAVNFPMNDFNLRPHLVIDPDSSNTLHNNSRYYNYNLYAISNHFGSMGGGHYTAFCKSSALNKWYKYDDQTVTEVAESYVRSQHSSAYLLFYSSMQCEPSTYI